MKNLFLPLLIFLAQVVYGQKVTRVETATNYSIHVFGDHFQGVIFSKEFNSKWMTLKKEGKVYAIDSLTLSAKEIEKYRRFTPSTEDIDSAENILQTKLKQLSRKMPKEKFIKGPNVYRHLQKYARQYFGFVLINNQKIIFINSFWDDGEIKTGKDWLEDFYQVFDGGNNYWQVKVNLTTHQLFDFGVDGAL